MAASEDWILLPAFYLLQVDKLLFFSDRGILLTPLLSIFFLAGSRSDRLLGVGGFLPAGKGRTSPPLAQMIKMIDMIEMIEMIDMIDMIDMIEGFREVSVHLSRAVGLLR